MCDQPLTTVVEKRWYVIHPDKTRVLCATKEDAQADAAENKCTQIEYEVATIVTHMQVSTTVRSKIYPVKEKV